MNKILAVLLFFASINLAFADFFGGMSPAANSSGWSAPSGSSSSSGSSGSSGRGKYVVVTNGNSAGSTVTGSQAAVDVSAGSSVGVFLGYQFDNIFSAEAGYTSLYNSTAIFTSSSTAIGTASLDSIELAALAKFHYKIKNFVFYPFLRYGYVEMTATQNLSSTYGGGSTTTAFSGTTYGVGAQFDLSKRFGVRIGYNVYNLNDSFNETWPVDNLYFALLLKL